MTLSMFKPNDQRAFVLGLAVFWLGVFILNAGPHWEVYSSIREMLETAGMKTGLQIFVAVIALKFLVPATLDKGRWFLFLSLTLVLVIIAAEINILIRYLYLEPRYPDSYKQFLSMFSHKSLIERMDLTWALRYILFTKLPQFTFPAVLIAAYLYYQKQQTLLMIKEQKANAELGALKNQLNPHFVFNTLNNIYALAIKKSDQTPVAIEKLSAILDYVVYRCTEHYVPLESEIELIENYVALEKIRYADRLNFSLTVDVTKGVKIAPLLLLTLIENACKHSTREEINQSTVSVNIVQKGSDLVIEVRNTKPEPLNSEAAKIEKVGLRNLQKQLDLLYPNAYRYSVVDGKREYVTELVLSPVHD